jgi:hypothetical protein
VDLGGVMGVQAVRIGCGSTWAAAQDALLVLDLNADGTCGAGDGRIDRAEEVVPSLWDDAGMRKVEWLRRDAHACAKMGLAEQSDRASLTSLIVLVRVPYDG